MKSKYHSGNVGLLAACLILGLIGIPVSLGVIGERVSDAKWEKEYGSNHVDSYMTMGEPHAEYLGEKFNGESEDGFGYVRIYIPILNRGTSDEYEVSFQIEDTDEYELYSDVNRIYSYGEGPFEFDLDDKVFPGQVGNVSYVYQIKDTVSEIKLMVYDSYDDYQDKKNGKGYMVPITR